MSGTGVEPARPSDLPACQRRARSSTPNRDSTVAKTTAVCRTSITSAIAVLRIDRRHARVLREAACRAQGREVQRARPGDGQPSVLALLRLGERRSSL